jgi:hypothetical protein
MTCPVVAGGRWGATAHPCSSDRLPSGLRRLPDGDLPGGVLLLVRLSEDVSIVQ